MNSLVAHCRPGFESEVCAELSDYAQRLGLSGYAKAKPLSALAEFVATQDGAAQQLMQSLRFAELIFVRQWACGQFVDLPETDRISVLLEALKDYPVCGSVWLEMPDTNEGKALSTFCRQFAKPLGKALKGAGRIVDNPELPRLLLTFNSSRQVFVGVAPVHNSAKWPMGIARLKFPHSAPSRSTLKLEEAWHHFIARSDWDARLAEGMSAVDLGASPGGWTWQLVKREMLVTAIDNGPMAESLMATGLVEHLQVDGFAYRPKQRVNWMVCDIVEKPAKSAALLEIWIGEGLCTEAVVNLKLPMKQRYSEVRKLLEKMQEGFSARGLKVQMGCKQLYYDREEVTCHVRRL